MWCRQDEIHYNIIKIIYINVVIKTSLYISSSAYVKFGEDRNMSNPVTSLNLKSEIAI